MSGTSFIAKISMFLREVPFLKRDAIEKNHCSIELSPFGVRNLFSVLATPMSSSVSMFIVFEIANVFELGEKSIYYNHICIMFVLMMPLQLWLKYCKNVYCTLNCQCIWTKRKIIVL